MARAKYIIITLREDVKVIMMAAPKKINATINYYYHDDNSMRLLYYCTVHAIIFPF